MLRLSERRRALLAEKFGDLANLAVVALVFGQAIGQEMFSLRLGATGTAIWSLLTAYAIVLSGGDP